MSTVSTIQQLINRINRFSFKTVRNMKTLETLNFDNSALRKLPIDTVSDNYVRTVNNACFSRVMPTPVLNPQLVAYSTPALKLLELENEVERPEFVEHFSGNKLLIGSQTASHCYCGHQFGSFAGQLGDGAAIYLGEVINSLGERWELQLKGAGPTPYSREADGRKVLRSSVREFLCSEAMHALGVPTTRSATVITSDDKVVRDMFYDGNPRHERCTVISRIAQSFIRFGSFEIFKTVDPMTGRRGPSVGRDDILKDLVHYVIETLFPDIFELDVPLNEKYKRFYEEVVVRTAKLVALWQCVGFCHGVLNTDNMSVVGLTLDYGPFGFLDRFDTEHVCNSSDDGGRYTYGKQPEICHWNLFKFAEALNSIIPIEELKPILEANYYKAFNSVYNEKMLKKFGLFSKVDRTVDNLLSDDEIISIFLDTLQKTGSDFTNSFRALSLLVIPNLDNHQQSIESLKNELLSQSSSVEELIAANEASYNSREIQLFLMIMQTNPQLLEMMGRGPQAYERVIAKLEENEKLKEISPETKKQNDSALWEKWIEKYIARIDHDISSISGDNSKLVEHNSMRTTVMNENNPKYILRNYLAQKAIERAEEGDFDGVRSLLKVLEKPYSSSLEFDDIVNNLNNDECKTKTSNCCQKPPVWSSKLRVSCSS